MPPSLLVLVLGVIGLLVAEKYDHAPAKAVTKLSASTAFMTLAWSEGALQSDYGIAVLVALALSWIGDACLLSKKERVFLVGIFAFLLGHVGYIVAFAVRGVDPTWAGAAALGIGAFALVVDRWLIPQADPAFRLPVRAYIAVISVMACLAIGCFGAGHTWLIPAGAVAFFTSDLTVAMDRFVQERWRNRVVGLPLYYGAQVLLAFSVGA